MNPALGFPAISDFLKDTFGESLRRPLQPSGLFTAAIFVFLNLLLVFPPLAEWDAELVTTFFGLAAAWQIAVSTAAVLILAYVLVALSSSILRLLSGESWEESWPGRVGARSQASRLAELNREFEQIANRADQLRTDAATAGIITPQGQRLTVEADRLATLLARKTWEKSTRFPIAEGQLAPTALGNVLRSIASYITDRYGADMTALWPHMETAIAGETALASRINNEKATLDFLLNLTFMLVVFAVEFAILQTGLRRWPDVLLTWAFLGLAYLFYRAAVAKAVGWGAAVELAFDLHREKLRQALGLRVFRSKDDERKVWAAVSAWLLWGVRADAIFIGEPAPSGTAPADRLAVTTSSNVAVSFKHLVATFERTPPVGPHPVVEWEETLNYLLLVASTPDQDGRGQPAAGAYVVVADPQVRRIDPLPTADPIDWPGGVPTATLLPRSDPAEPARLIWRIGRVAPHGTSALRYRVVRRFRVAADPALLLVLDKIEVHPEAPQLRYEFQVRNGQPTVVPAAALEVTDSRIVAPTAVEAFSVPVGPGAVARPLAAVALPGGDGHRLPIGNVAVGATLTVHYRVTLPSVAGG